MFNNIIIAPSIGSLFITGILVLSILFLFVSNFNQFMRLPYFQKISILSLICIAIGIHGLIHLGAETTYGFNPYNWF